MSAILRQEVARWISIVGHPFVFVVLVVGLTTWKLDGAAQALRLTAIFLLVAVVPLWIFM